MARRDIEKVDQSHDRQIWTMESPSDTAGWRRLFPDPMPATHEFRYRWDGEKKLILECVPRIPAGENRESVPTPMPTTHLNTVAELSKLPRPDLDTKAAIVGVAVTDKMSDAQLVAKITEKVHENDIPDAGSVAGGSDSPPAVSGEAARIAGGRRIKKAAA